MAAHLHLCRFRWVYYQLETLSRSIPARVRQVMHELPETLDATSERTLKAKTLAMQTMTTHDDSSNLSGRLPTHFSRGVTSKVT